MVNLFTNFNLKMMLFWHIIYLFKVYADGGICLDILQNRWSPTYDVSAILTSIQVSIFSSFVINEFEQNWKFLENKYNLKKQQQRKLS